MKWQYKIVHIDWQRKDLNGDRVELYDPADELNELGEEGWELVSAIDDGEDAIVFTAILKRRKDLCQ